MENEKDNQKHNYFEQMLDMYGGGGDKNKKNDREKSEIERLREENRKLRSNDQLQSIGAYIVAIILLGIVFAIIFSITQCSKKSSEVEKQEKVLQREALSDPAKMQDFNIQQELRNNRMGVLYRNVLNKGEMYYFYPENCEGKVLREFAVYERHCFEITVYNGYQLIKTFSPSEHSKFSFNIAKYSDGSLYTKPGYYYVYRSFDNGNILTIIGK